MRINKSFIAKHDFKLFLNLAEMPQYYTKHNSDYNWAQIPARCRDIFWGSNLENELDWLKNPKRNLHNRNAPHPVLSFFLDFIALQLENQRHWNTNSCILANKKRVLHHEKRLAKYITHHNPIFRLNINSPCYSSDIEKKRLQEH